MKILMDIWRDPNTGKPVLTSDDRRLGDGKGLVISSDWLSSTMRDRVEAALKQEGK